MSESVAYLVHFEQPIGGEGRKSARHYIGYTKDITRRMREHRAGGEDAAHILAYLKQARIGWRVVRLWRHGGYDLEMRIKGAGHFDKLCPVCAGEAALRRGAYGHESVAVDDPALTHKRPPRRKR